MRWRPETPRAAAGRLAMASAIACGCVVWPDVGRADDAPTLFLGRAEALRVVETARQARERAAGVDASYAFGSSPVVAAPSMPGIVPPRFHIPDGYEIDVDRDVPRFAAPVDRDNLVSFELLDRSVGVFLDYDEESYPIGPGGETLMLQIERRF